MLRELLTVLSVTVALVGGGVWLADRHLEVALDETRRAAEHDVAVSRSLARVLALTAELEAGSRGRALGVDPMELDPTEAAWRMLPAALRQLRDVLGRVDDGAAPAEADRLASLVARRHREAVDPSLAAPLGRQLVVELREQLDRVCALEQAADQRRRARQDARRREARRLLATAALGAVLLALSLFSWAHATLSAAVGRLEGSAEALARGDFHRPIPDERWGLGRLAASLRATQRGLLARDRRVAELLAALQRSTQTKTDLLAVLGHELRTPLNGIIGFSRLLVDGAQGPLDERKDACARQILASGHHLLGLLDDLLDLSKLQAGRLSVRLSPCALHEAAATVIESLRPVAAQAGVRLGVERPDDGGPIVRADPVRLRQVLTNLVDNAIKFTPRGGRVTVAVTLASGEHGRCEVRDTGPGIGHELLAQLFQPFAQLDGRRARGGTGLGLVLSKQLLERMGGRIELVSSPGAGATFRFELPLDGADRSSRVEPALHHERP